MKLTGLKAFAIAASVAVAAPASAETFDFTGGALSVGNYVLTPLFNSFSTSGDVLTAAQPSGSFTITSLDNSLFKISSFDFAPTASSPFVDIFNSTGSPVYSFSGSTAGTISYGTTGGAFDTGLSNKFTFNLYGYGATGASLSLDNIVITSVPEPATWAMMVLGLGAVGMTLRRRRNSQAGALVLAKA